MWASMPTLIYPSPHSKHLRGNSTHHRIWWDVAVHYRARGHNRASAYSDTIEDDGSGTEPAIVLNHDALPRNPLLLYGRGGVRIDVVFRMEADPLPNGYPLAYLDA